MTPLASLVIMIELLGAIIMASAVIGELRSIREAVQYSADRMDVVQREILAQLKFQSAELLIHTSALAEPVVVTAQALPHGPHGPIR